MTTILSSASLPSQAVNPTNLYGRNVIWTTADGYRILLYADPSGNLSARAAANGSTWSGGTSLVTVQTGITAMSKLITSCWCDASSTLYVFIAHSTTVDCILVPYSGAGVFGTPTLVSGLISGLTAAPLSICAALDAGATTVDFQANPYGKTGIITLLVDSGSAWNLYALDPNTQATTKPKVVLSQALFSTGIVGPTANTMLIVRKTGALYAITPGQSAWYAWPITYQSTTTTVSGGTTGPSSIGLPTGLLHAEIIGSLSGSSIAGFTYPTGTWSLSLTFTGGTGTSNITVTVQNGDAFGWGTVGSFSASAVPLTGTQTVSGTITGFTVGTQVRVLVDFTNTGGSSLSSGSVTTPVPTKPSTTSQTVNQYVFGALEQPTLPYYQYGVGLCPTNESEPSIDLFVVRSTDSHIVSQRRNGTGGYSTLQDLGGTALTGQLAATLDPSSGSEAVFALATASGLTQVHAVQKIVSGGTGAWGALAPISTAATSVVDYAAIHPRGLGIAGQAEVDADSSATRVLAYNDASFASGAVAPTAPTNVMLVGSGSFGTSSPFNTTNATPSIQATYNEATANDPMGAIRYQVQHGGGPTTDWDSGLTPVSSGPLPGGTYTSIYGAIGAAASALVAGTTYTASVTMADSAKNLSSPPSTTITFTLYSVPAIDIAAPLSAITTFTSAVTFDWWQAQKVPAVNVHPYVKDSHGKSVLDLGFLPFGSTTPTTVSSNYTTGTSLVVVDSIPGGSVIVVSDADGSNPDVATVNSVSGTGPYTLTLAAGLAHSHVAGGRVARRITTPAQVFWPSGLKNLTGYTLYIDAWGQPASGPQISATTSVPFSLALPQPPAPHDLNPVLFTGNTPIDSPRVRLDFIQDAGNGSTIPNPGTWKVYYRLHDRTNTAAWTLYNSMSATASGSPVSINLYSLGNNVEYDIAVSSVSPDGVESNLATIMGITLSPQPWQMLVFNDPSDPSLSVGLGYFDAGSDQFPLLVPTQQVDDAYLFNRTFPVTTVSPVYSRATSQQLVFDLEVDGVSYADDVKPIMRAWDAAQTTLQIRDPYGEVWWCTVRGVTFGARARSSLETVTLSIIEKYGGRYGPLLD